jgi:hypothetical protein
MNMSDSKNKFICTSLDLKDLRELWILCPTRRSYKTHLMQNVSIQKFYGNDHHKNCCQKYILLHHCFIQKHSMKVGKPIMTDNSPTHFHPQGLMDRTIEPTDVIKEFNLCYRLACVVKHLTRTKRRAATLKDLHKAAKHLAREIKRHQDGMAICVFSSGKKPLFTISEILEDWRLTPNLEKALFHILHSCQLPPPGLEGVLFPGKGSMRLSDKSKDFFYRTLPLIKAMRFLNLEISELQAAEQERRGYS